MSVTDSPLQQSAYDPVAWNFKLIAQHTLDGFGGMGEGMSMQVAPDGRRALANSRSTRCAGAPHAVARTLTRSHQRASFRAFLISFQHRSWSRSQKPTGPRNLEC